MLETYVIHVTKECNCDCLYCYEKDKFSRYTWEEVKLYIDDIIKNRTSDVFQIEFLGGEPMLAWDLIQKSYEYIESFNDINVTSYIITTNGTIMNSDILDYLRNNDKFVYGVSLDGIKWANQMRVFKSSRKNTYDSAIANLMTVQNEGIKHYVHMVTTPYNVAFLFESIQHLYKKGIKRFAIGIVETTMEIDAEFIERYIDELKKVSDFIVNSKASIDINEFEYLKPFDDVRTYIRDEQGKLIGETYGRSGDDITKEDNAYNIKKCDITTPTSRLIYMAKKSTYDYHQQNLKNRG